MTQDTGKTAELIAGLQGDLAREYKAVIQYVIYSQKIDRAQYQNIATELEAHAHEELDHAISIAQATRLLWRLSDPRAGTGRGLRGERGDAVVRSPRGG